jgi:hypothetical protein
MLKSTRRERRGNFSFKGAVDGGGQQPVKVKIRANNATIPTHLRQIVAGVFK